MQDPKQLWELVSDSEEETLALGRRLGEVCSGGEILLLDGPLGAGKTRLANGLAQGLGIMQPVISPTYVILRSYTGSRALTLHHFDFYRLGGDNDLDTVGVEDCLDDDSVVLAEWPGRCPGAFDEFTLALQIDPIGENERRIIAWAGALAGEEFVAIGKK